MITTLTLALALAVQGGTRVHSIGGFDIPESVQYEASLDLYYVSNVTAHATRKDNTGFISRVRPDGTIESLKFIEGGRNGVVLHAPKGMAFRGDTLWVIDVDSVRAFHKRTGVPLTAIDLTPFRPRLLNDLAFAPDGTLYITDTGLEFVEPAGVKWSREFRIFRRTRAGRAELVLQDTMMQGPNGILWDPARNALLIGSLITTPLMTWRPGERTVTVVARGGGGFDGITRTADGRIIVSAQDASAIQELIGDRVVTLLGGIRAPGDIGLDTRRNRVLIPLLNDNRVEVWQLNATTVGTWSSGPPLQFTRSAHAVIATPDAIYAFGGSGAGTQPVLQVERFDGTRWITETTLPEGLNAPAAVRLGSRIYLIGGFSGVSNLPTDKVRVYDTATKQWSEAAPLPAPRGGHAAVVRQGRIHVLGGGNNRSTIADHSVYDPATNTWADRAPLPRAQGSPAGILFEENVWAIGGRSGSSDFGEVYIYDAERDRWTTGPPVEPRGTAGVVVFDGTIWLMGGESQARQAVLNSVLRLDPVSRSWRNALSLPTARNYARAVVFQDAIWTVGGSTSAGASHSAVGSATVERFVRSK